MTVSYIEEATGNARSVATAASSVLRALGFGGDLDAAVDRLELQAARCLVRAPQSFDSGTDSGEDIQLAQAISLFGIGTTLVQVDLTLDSAEATGDLAASITQLEKTADAIEALSARPERTQGFDPGSAGPEETLRDVALRVLDQMAHAAAGVAQIVLDKAGRFTKQVQDYMSDVSRGFEMDVPGRLIQWAVRCVRRGLEMLLRLVDLPAIERQRAILGSVLDRLGAGEDPRVLAGWFIGADSARAAVSAVTDLDFGPLERRRELAHLGTRYARQCQLLRRAAVLLAGVAALLAPVDPRLAAVAAPGGLVVVLGATLLLGRAHTAGGNLFGGIRGVQTVIRNS